MKRVAQLAAGLVVAGLIAGRAAAAVSPQPDPGVYKHRFANGDVQGDSFTSENILEVVPYQPKVDYIRLHLEFYNGQMCDIWGMARFTAKGLLYQGPGDSRGEPCQLRLEQREDGVHISEGDNGACRDETCGERGGYGWRSNHEADFTPAERQDILYLPKLLASSQYQAAAAAYEAGAAR